MYYNSFVSYIKNNTEVNLHIHISGGGGGGDGGGSGGGVKGGSVSRIFQFCS